MISLRQFQILNACAIGPQLFYAPFAEVNYGGQVFEGARDPDAEKGGVNYEHDREWSVMVTGRAVADDILALMEVGLLAGCRFGEGLPSPYYDSLQKLTAELKVYEDYDCVTYGDHYEAFGGYGPHEFEITAQGLTEINRPEYEQYVERLGWNQE